MDIDTEQKEELEDYNQFCDTKQIVANSQKQSTKNDTLLKKREREDEEKQNEKDVKNPENNNVFMSLYIKLLNN